MRPILVVKISGSAGVDTERIYADIAQISQQYRVVVVHGVSERIAQLSDARGMAVTMLTSPNGHQSRYTPPAVRDLFVEAANALNMDIVDGLHQHHVSAVGMTNVISLHGERKNAIRAIENGRIRIVRDDYSGRIERVQTDALYDVLHAGAVPVVPPLAQSADGLLNVDGDRASARIAGALNAESLVILSNVSGIYRDYTNPQSLVSHVSYAHIDEAMDWAEGRMKRKVLGAQEAIEGGVGQVIIADGSQVMPISRAMQGAGTVFTA